MQTTIGFDLSINSTACTVQRGNKFEYFVITNKISKKFEKCDKIPKNLNIIIYNKIEIDKENNTIRENTKSNNIFTIYEHMRDIVLRYKPQKVQIEGISYGSSNTRSIVELSGLNYLLRYLCYTKNIEFIIVPPTTLKKFATGNGVADKELMVESFCVLHPEFRDLVKVIKIDDIADSYFLSQYSI